jgi:hypothetical protein
MTWGMLLAVALLAMLALFWHSSLAARELANRVAMETCTSANVQMLDGTVAIHRLRVVRGGDAALLASIYVFDYTEDGFARKRGFVVLTGDAIDSVGTGTEGRMNPQSTVDLHLHSTASDGMLDRRRSSRTSQAAAWS